MELHLRQLSSPHWVSKLSGCDPPACATFPNRGEDSLWVVTVTGAEVSIVSPDEPPPHAASTEGPWTVFEVAGPLDFSLVGIINTLTGPLVAAGVPVFVVSTFDTDYLLTAHDKSAEAAAAWLAAGVVVTTPPAS